MKNNFDEKYPNIVAWVQDGWVEIGRVDFTDSFIRVLLDEGGTVWEGKSNYPSVSRALDDAELAIGKCQNSVFILLFSIILRKFSLDITKN
ncbi:MAG: hypothetical protein QNJ46_29305 [Leptolyngbyaceae cyanobacterium MO_188.B28]|nr:hypothetical protein [Leptolyngbyaceae cyanobacterium MO_188.B28]